MAKKNREVTAVDILVYAKGLLSKRGGWTKGVYARNKQREKVLLRSTDAVCFCADGAMMRACADLKADDIAYGNAYAALSGVANHDIVHFNDSQTYKRPVIRAFSRAIKKLVASNA